MSDSIKNPLYDAQQTAFAEKLKDMLLARHGKKPKAYIVTYGCQQNVSDSEKIKGMLHVCGYEFTDSPEDAQFILFNTCAVRGHAEDRVLGNVGAMKKHKKENPDIIIAICGCMAQQQVNADRFTKSYPYVDIIFGTQVTHRLPEFIYKRITSQKRIKELALDNEKIVENVPICRDGTFKAFVSVMYGCNNFCSYCIVPYVRGAERSRESKEIIKEVEELVAAGYKEIMLLGQNVNSYGLGLKEDINFARLLRRINEIDGDFRIRFMTSHPKDCTIELLETIRDCEKIERHLHLPFQSGSNRILKMMNRRYTRESYLSLIESAKEIIPDVTFTSDIIVGFPGETKPDFEETLSLIKQVEFLSLFTFIYSPRNGTPAAIMDDPVSREEKGEWFSRLLKLQEEIENKKREEYIGKTYRVLAEEISVKTGRLVGKSSNGIGVEFPANKNLIGEFCTVKIIGYENAFIGEIIR